MWFNISKKNDRAVVIEAAAAFGSEVFTGDFHYRVRVPSDALVAAELLTECGITFTMSNQRVVQND